MELGGAQVVAAKKNYIAKQQRWLLFLRHCAKCQAQEGVCQYGESCTVAKQLWRHILTCSGQQCSYPRCACFLQLGATGGNETSCERYTHSIRFKNGGCHSVTKPTSVEAR